MNAPRRPRRTLLPIVASSLLLVTTLLYAGYTWRRASHEREAIRVQGAKPGEGALAPRYPPAFWRLAPAQLENVVLWPAHILISHKDAKSKTSPFLAEAFWQRASADRSKITRSREEAFALATRLAVDLRVEPSRFSELASKYSDDPATRPWNGSLGAVPGPRINPEILDVLAQLRPGEASRPVESDWGFHIFTHEPAVPPDVVTGREIVVSYVGTAGWLVDNPQLPERRYADAVRLSEQIFERVRADPSSFGAIAQEASERYSRLIGGEIGPWSTTDPGDDGRVVAVLSRMRIGEIAKPIETPAGIHIVQRTEPPPVRRYVVGEIGIDYSAGRITSGRSSTRDQAIARLAEIAPAVRRDPLLFERYAREVCCASRRTWLGARGDARLIAALSGAKARDIVGPIEFPELKRIGIYQLIDNQLAAQNHRAVDSAVPWPRSPDIDDFVLHADSTALGQVANELMKNVEFTGNSEQEKRRLHEQMREFARRLTTSATGAERARALRKTREAARALLGNDRFTKFMNGVEAYLSEIIVYRL